MSLKKIQFKVYADKTINRTVPYTIKQGEINEYNIVLDPTLLIPAGSGYTCYIKFKRPNNTKSGDILMTYNNNGLYSYVIKDDWVLNYQGKLSITFEARQTVNNEVTSILLGNTFLYVSPNADYTEYAALPPDNITILNERIDSEVSTLNDKIDANYDDLSVNKLNRNFTTYDELDWENLQPTDKLVINRPITNELNESDVEVYYADVDDLYNSVNGVDADSTGNISIDGNDIPYDSNDSITDKIDSLQEQVTSNDSDIADLDTNKVNKSDLVTYYAYAGEEEYTEPVLVVQEAEFAVKDQNGNTIDTTYATKEELTSADTSIRNDVANTYLTTANASSTYLTQSDASTTYATKTEVNAKQDTLTAGTGISISNNVVSNTKKYYRHILALDLSTDTYCTVVAHIYNSSNTTITKETLQNGEYNGLQFVPMNNDSFGAEYNYIIDVRLDGQNIIARTLDGSMRTVSNWSVSSDTIYEI